MYWKDSQCEAYVNPKPAPAVNQTHPLTLNADGMFDFDRSDLGGLQPKGRQSLKDLVGQIKSGYSKIHSINVVGYTDRLGSPQYNQQLSFDRANTVKQYFTSQGLDASIIVARGMGSSKPVVICPGPKSGTIINCLLPNRRIEVVVNGDI